MKKNLLFIIYLVFFSCSGQEIKNFEKLGLDSIIIVNGTIDCSQLNLDTLLVLEPYEECISCSRREDFFEYFVIYNTIEYCLYYYDTSFKLVNKTPIPAKFRDTNFGFDFEKNKLQIHLIHANFAQERVDYEDIYSLSGVFIRRKYFGPLIEVVKPSKRELYISEHYKIIIGRNIIDTSSLANIIKINT